ncbi:AraC family transcriptional regulator [Sphingobium fontiphilum]|uniref:AraC family transcriptional regulator n=1 Tax=Sphingobium fontiphilum TaxID=944425 RepID=A0A7W6GQP3_9SPHN|nr:AraC family transcriptional regulator [Sphingobium fontiphilum]MBB3982279.1 AraC family transcriptional regulator [Sphingobium fontiphilum]
MREEAAATIPLCAPHTASHFHVERQIHTNGIFADIRHFGWTQSSRSVFRPDSYYLDFSIGPRCPASRFFKSERQLADPPGDIVFLPKGGAFATLSEPGEHSLLCLTFANERAMQLFEDDSVAHLSPCQDVQIGRVRQGLARLVEELRNPGFGQDILLESMALMLVVELCRHFRSAQYDDRSAHGQMPGWRLRRVKDRIEADLAGSLSVADLAAEIRTSPRHLIRTFKATTGTTLTDYIAGRRIVRAQEQLAHEDLMIKMIAGNCGFQSAAAFSAAFRKATGMTPREYREARIGMG